MITREPEILRVILNSCWAQDLSDDVKVSVIMDICPKQLQEHVELMYREESYQRVRDEIIQYTQRHRSQSPEHLVAMDIGVVNQQSQGEWDHWDYWNNDENHDLSSAGATHSVASPSWNTSYNEDFEQQAAGTEMQYIGGKNGVSNTTCIQGPRRDSERKEPLRLEQWHIGEGSRDHRKAIKDVGKGQKGGKGKGRLLLQSVRFLKAIVIIVENGHSVSRFQLLAFFFCEFLVLVRTQ